MPTNNKTSNLNLNNWLSTDKPKREDFVNDNIILDTVINNHLNNSSAHLSSSDRALLTSPFVCGILAGDGNETKTHTLSFEPKFVFICKLDQAFSKYDGNMVYNIVNHGVAIKANSTTYCTLGVALSGRNLTLTQYSTKSNGYYVNLNSNGGQYIYIAFK